MFEFITFKYIYEYINYLRKQSFIISEIEIALLKNRKYAFSNFTLDEFNAFNITNYKIYDELTLGGFNYLNTLTCSVNKYGYKVEFFVRDCSKSYSIIRNTDYDINNSLNKESLRYESIIKNSLDIYNSYKDTIHKLWLKRTHNEGTSQIYDISVYKDLIYNNGSKIYNS